MDNQQNFITKLQNANVHNKFLKFVFAINILVASSLIFICINLAKLNKGAKNLEEIFPGLRSMINSASSVLNMLYFIFIISVVAISLMIINYRQHKENLTRPDILLSLVSNGSVILFFIFNFKTINATSKFLKSFKSGNFMSTLLDAPDISSLPNFNSIVVIGVMIFIVDLIAIALGYFKLFKNKDILNNLSFSNVGTSAMKINKKIVIPIVVFVISISGYFVYKNFIYKKDVDLLSNINLKYDGLSGKGSAVIEGTPKTTDDPEINKFLQTVHYKLSKDNGLKNGDIISITADFDLDLMKKYNIKVTEIKKDLTVDELNKLAVDISEIPQNILDKIKNDRQKDIESSHYKIKNFTTKSVDTYYKVSDNNNNNGKSISIMFLYNIEYDETKSNVELIHKVDNVVMGGNNIVLDKDNNLVNYDSAQIPNLSSEEDSKVSIKVLENKGYLKIQ
ncbi:hypothetical protein [Clostridium algidicarnis]|uniref:hypothetical protein n=1 Tax=Clostridium algidicarnis TaxID=37659 RepID=UPI0004950877|nr:hypothetical protein [Clostridium algidicarnis]